MRTKRYEKKDSADDGKQQHASTCGGATLGMCKCSCCSSGGKEKHRFIPVQALNDDMAVVYVSSTMIMDHLPDRYVYELRTLAQRFSVASHGDDADAGVFVPVNQVSVTERALLSHAQE